MVHEQTTKIDVSKRPAMVKARRELLEAANAEAMRIVREVDPDDRAPEQMALVDAVSSVVKEHRHNGETLVGPRTKR